MGLVRSVAFHPDAARVAIADYGQSQVHLWDLAAGTRITNPGPRAVSCVEFTPDGKRLAVLGTMAASTCPTPGPATRCWCFAPPNRPPAAAATRPGWPSAPMAPESSPIPLTLDCTSGSWASSGPGGRTRGRRRRGLAAAQPRPAERDAAADAEAAFASVPDENSATIHPPGSCTRRGFIAVATSYGHGTGAGAGQGGPARRPVLWVDLGRRARRCRAGLKSRRRSCAGPIALSAAALPRARRPGAAAALAELLPDADESSGWTILQPEVMTSADGATLTRLPDGSVLAGGRNPVADTYTVEAVTTLAGITALRIEAHPRPEPAAPRAPAGIRSAATSIWTRSA